MGVAVQGVGAAVVMPLAMGLLGAAFPPERRGRAIGVFSGVTGVAVLGGPMIGGAVTEGLAWQWIFWINVPVGLVAIPLVLRSLAMPAAQSAAMRALPREAVGIASGVYSMTRQLGGAAGVAVLGSVFVSAGGYGGHGFTWALAGCGVLSLLGALAGLGITARLRTGGLAASKAMEEVR